MARLRLKTWFPCGIPAGLLLTGLCWTGAGAFGDASDVPPEVSSLLKPAVYEKVMKQREVMSHASLVSLKKARSADESGIEPKRYSYYAAMLVREDLKRAREVLTNYPLYAKMIPYVEKAEYSKETRVLDVEGGIWKFKLASQVRFEDVNDRWIRYRVIGGHFMGLTGDIFFEPAPKGTKEGRTVVLIRGAIEGAYRWPPTFVIERGAEIVFGFTGRRMRSYIESNYQAVETKTVETKKVETGEESTGESKNEQVPQPRNHL